MYITKFVISFSYSVFFVDKILNDSLYVNFYFIKNISPPPPPFLSKVNPVVLKGLCKRKMRKE